MTKHVVIRTGSSAPDVNLDNPPVKDTVVVPATGYTVVRFETKNPGFWLFHCHTALHQVEGMALIFNISGNTPAPKGFPTCQNFDFNQDDAKLPLTEGKRNESLENCRSQDSGNVKETHNCNWDANNLVETLSITITAFTSLNLLLQIVLLIIAVTFLFSRKASANIKAS